MEKRIKKERDYFKVTEKEKSKIKKVIRDTLRKNKKIKTVIIFGSFINRKYFHDIDIAIIGKLSMEEAMSLQLKLSKNIGFEVDIKAFDNLEEIPELFKFLILGQGKIILERHKDININIYRHEFVKSYLDFLEFSKKWIF